LAHNNLGLVLQQQGKLEEAIAQYKKAIAIDPNYVYASNNLKKAQRLLTIKRRLAYLLRRRFAHTRRATFLHISEL
jgi:tetratricopeptide (TPR) repeat protein